MDYVYGTLSNSNGESPLNYSALQDNPMELWVVATDAVTGEAEYFNKKDFKQDDYSVLKASSSIPLVCKSYMVQGKAYYDGGLGDPVPIQKAFELGCDKVVLILTKPENQVRNSVKKIKLQPLSIRSILKLLKVCAAGQSYTIKAWNWHRNMLNKEEC